MIRLAIIAALIAAPAFAATVEDPDSPRFADGLRVLGMRGEVKIERVLEVEGIDREPLYLAQTPEREAFFRAGEDLCMAKGKLGHEIVWQSGIEDAPPFPAGFRTSRLSKRMFADLITFVAAYGDRHGVHWSEPPPSYEEGVA